MMEFEQHLERVGKEFLKREIASGFPIIGLMKHPEIQMRMDWLNRLEERQKQVFVDDVFRDSEKTPLVKEFDSLLIKPMGANYAFPSRKNLLKMLKKDGGRWDFSDVDVESISAFYNIGAVRLGVFVCATNKAKNIEVDHVIYKENQGLVGAFKITHVSHFYYCDAWRAENLQAEQEYDSVMKVLNCGYDMLCDAILSCGNPFGYIK